MKEENGLGIAGFVLGLVGLLFLWIPPLAVVIAIVGLVLSIIQLRKHKTGLAIAGLILSILALVILLVILITALLVFNAVEQGAAEVTANTQGIVSQLILAL